MIHLSHILKYNNLYKEIYFRDNGICQLCGNKTSLETESLNEARIFKIRKNLPSSLENNILICKNCSDIKYNESRKNIKYKRKYNKGNRKLIHKLYHEGDKSCYYCKIKLDANIRKHSLSNTATIDHKTPVSRNGAHDIENLVICNTNKGDMTEEEFKQSNYYQAKMRNQL